MKLLTHLLFFLASLGILSSSAGAASRTVQFSGNTSNYISKLKMDRYEGTTLCAVSLVNTGSTAQKVTSITFVTYDDATQKATNQGATYGVIYNGGASASCGITAGSPCLNTDISSGGIFIATRAVDPSFVSGAAINVCAGQITVEDSNSAQPGSVVASGSIAHVTEEGITGGQFNGALYFSGSQVPASLANNTVFGVADDPTWTNSSTPTAPLFPTLPADSWETTNQMNLFCSQACRKAAAGNATELAWCSDLCSTQSGAHGHPGKRILAYNETNGGGNNLSHLVKTADPRWAGGLVMEMIVGPFDSICSGNKEYFTRGNTDFSHTDTIDKDGGLHLASPDIGSKGPPERLYCAHTHHQDAPFGYQHASNPFTINAGLPF